MKYVKEFIEYILYQKNYSTYTVNCYKTDLKELKVFIGNNKNIYQIEYQKLREYLSHLRMNENSRNTIARKISTIRSFLKFLYRENIIKYNSAELIIIPKKEKALPKFLTEKQVNQIIENISSNKILGMRNKAMLELLYSSGIRVNEIVQINRNDIDFSKRIILIRGKGKKERRVIFGSYAEKSLKEYLIKRGDKENAIFLNKNNKRITDRGIRWVIDKYVRENALLMKISPHTFRHSFATHLLNNGANLRSVQELLGHSSLSSTQIYTHLTTNKLKDIYSKSHPFEIG